MKIALLARLVSFLLVVALLLPALSAAAGGAPGRGRHYRGGLHRPVYKAYKPAKANSAVLRWIKR